MQVPPAAQLGWPSLFPEAGCAGGVPHGGDNRVIGEVGTHPRAVRDHPDPVLDELLGGADARQQQQVRAADSACRHDDLSLGPRHLFGTPAEITNPGSPAAVHDDARDQRVCVHGEVGPGGGGMQVCVRGRPAAAVFLRDLVEPGAVLGQPVEVLVSGRSAFPGGGHEGPRQRGLVLEVGDAERPGDAVVGRRPAGVVFGAQEIGEQIRITPSGAPVVITPRVVVQAVAPDVDHGVHG